MSKTFLYEQIEPLLKDGHLHFGENKVHEAITKWTGVKKTYPNLQLHMIGKLQTNKVKYLFPHFDYVHSLDSTKLAEKISNEEIKNKKKLKIFIQVNLAKEENKNGVSINDLSNLYEQSVKEFNLNIIGLMCIPPNNLPVSNFFKELKDLNSKFNLNELSMGMSQDYLEAANAGATYLRIGSRIFGSRI